MAMVLTALMMTAGSVSATATIVQTWREHAGKVASLAAQLRGSHAVGRMHFVVQAAEPQNPIRLRAIPVRLNDLLARDPRLAFG